MEWLSGNPSAIHLLEKNFDIYKDEKIGKINWDKFSTNPAAIPFLEKYLYKINWNLLSLNPEAIPLLKQYPEKINWHCLSQNTNPIAIEMLEEHP